MCSALRFQAHLVSCGHQQGSIGVVALKQHHASRDGPRIQADVDMRRGKSGEQNLEGGEQIIAIVLKDHLIMEMAPILS